MDLKTSRQNAIAYISGSSGRALVQLYDDVFFSFTVEDPYPRPYPENYVSNFFYLNADIFQSELSTLHDIKFSDESASVPGKSNEIRWSFSEANAILHDLWRKDRCLKFVNLLLDPDQVEEDRVTACKLAEGIFSHTGIKDFIQEILLSIPAPKDVDFPGARRIAEQENAHTLSGVLSKVPVSATREVTAGEIPVSWGWGDVRAWLEQHEASPARWGLGYIQVWLSRLNSERRFRLTALGSTLGIVLVCWLVLFEGRGLATAARFIAPKQIHFPLMAATHGAVRPIQVTGPQAEIHTLASLLCGTKMRSLRP